MKLKKILSVTGIAFAATALLTACGNSNSESDKTVLNVGVMSMTDSDVARWEKIQELVGDEVEIKFTEFTDYSQPNKALANGEVDINAFQHYNFLNNWNDENNSDLVVAADTYISPVNLFSGTDSSGKAKYSKVEDLPDGAQIAVPNDATNESRALYVLEAAGLIKLDVSGDELATVANIKENKKNLDIKEVDASQTARSLNSVDAAVINNSYAVDANVDYSTSLFLEDKEDENAHQWINVIAAQKDWESGDKADLIKKVIEAYHTDDVKKVIEETSNGVDVPVWD
jgi:D-methionine transport system substrate-binding protein